MNTQFTYPPKPTLVNIIAWMTLASGIVNLVWGIVAVLSIWWTVICIPLAILPSVLGIFEVIYAAKLITNPPQVVQPSTNIAILEIIAILAGNVFSVAVGILSLIFYNDVTVQDYFTRLNRVAPLTPVPGSPAAARVDPVPAPVPPPAVEESAPLEEPPSPDDESSKA